MTPPASTDAEPIEPGHRPRSRWRAATGLIAVVLAYLGIALGATQILPVKSATGLVLVDATSPRPHLLPRDRVQAAVTVRTIDPPRADRPTLAAVGGAADVFIADPALCAAPRAAEPAAVRVPRGYFPRGPPDVVRSAAA